jgi:hypothetical protein
VNANKRWIAVALAGIPVWQNQAIDLFHGTVEDNVDDLLWAVDEQKGGKRKDFGRGFYTTTSLEMAWDWAITKANQTKTVPAVVSFQVSRDLHSLCFPRGESSGVDFWSFVQYCRSVGQHHNRSGVLWYDVVIGPVSGSLCKQTLIPDIDQVSFHTPYAVDVLNTSLRTRVK